MKFFADLGNGGTLTIENVDVQTVLTLTTQAVGQQQSQQMSLSLGKWTASPTLFKLPGFLILQIDTKQQQAFVRLQANSVSLLTEMPLLINAQTIPLRNVPPSEPSTMPEMEPMKPMEPLRMGNMEMRMEPMEMKMGNMQLRMQSSSSSSSSPGMHFCPQCGTKVKESDRFCSNCGHNLKT